MIVFHDPAEVPADFGPTVVAIGKFDGVHSGHRAAISRARVEAATAGGRVVAVTFDRHPLTVLRPELAPEALTGVHQKLELLAGAGADATLLLRFDEELAAVGAEDFIDSVLVQALHARLVLVGSDFRFGARGAGNVRLLTERAATSGFEVIVVGDVRGSGGERRVSSTWIRELLSAGDVLNATRLLGRPPSVWGEVVHGLKRGRAMGFPTANLSPELEGFVPAEGVYAGWLTDEGPVSDEADGLRPTTRYPAAISIGTNPTFGDVARRQVEAYVLDETDLELYGHRVQVQFIDRVRSMVTFDSIDTLVKRMAEDVTQVRAMLIAESGEG